MADRPLTVLIFAHVFYPSHEIGAKRLTALARHLAAQGVRVIVVSEFGGREIAPDAEVLPGVIAIPVTQPRRLVLDTLVWIKNLRGSGGPRTEPAAGGVRVEEPATAAAGSEGALGRIKDAFFNFTYTLDRYKRWSWEASRAAVRAGRRYGVDVLLSSGPPFSPLIGARWAARRLGVPFVADLRDPWSDDPWSEEPWTDKEAVPEERGPKNVRRRARIYQITERLVLGTSQAITVTAEPYRELLAGRYRDRRVQLIRNGFDGAIRPARRETGGRLDILFAGEIYMERDPFPMLEAFERLVSRPDVDAGKVSLTFAGRCAAYRGRSLSEWLKGKPVEQVVHLLGQQTSDRVAQLIERSTVLLNLAQRQLRGVTAKTYEHLASGREMLVICEPSSGTARLVDGITGANVVDPTDSARLDAVLLDLYRRHVEQGCLAVPSERPRALYVTDRGDASARRLDGALAPAGRAELAPPAVPAAAFARSPR
jgi:hypothetical protein